MTLLPSDSQLVEAVEGDRYMVGPYCDAPGCKRPVDHKHHLWRRSFLGGDYWWVRVPIADDKTTTIRNVIGLCWQHHEDVTGGPGGHRAWIRWVEDPDQALHWLENDGYDHWISIGTLSLPAPPEAAPAPTRSRETERCPTCGHRIRPGDEHEHEPGPKRPRKTWTVHVPADSEDGAEILDELVEACAEIIGTDEYTSKLKRYHTLTKALYLVIQNEELIEVDG